MRRQEIRYAAQTIGSQNGALIARSRVDPSYQGKTFIEPFKPIYAFTQLQIDRAFVLVAIDLVAIDSALSSTESMMKSGLQCFAYVNSRLLFGSIENLRSGAPG